MKIVHVIPRLPYKGGLETLAAELCKSLAQQGNSVTLYCLNRWQREIMKEDVMGQVKVKKFRPIIDDPFYLPSRRMSVELRNESADIIQIHNIQTLLPFAVPLFSKFPTARMVLHPHYHEFRQKRLRIPFFHIYRRILSSFVPKRYDAVVVNSTYEENALRRDLPTLTRMIRLVPEEYSLDVPPALKWSSPRQPISILYVGVLVKYKNVDVLIRAFKILATSRKDLRLTIIGDGPEKKSLMALALDLGINDKIVWKGQLPSVYKEYVNASVVVLLSELESFSRVAHEAVAIGTPLITYNYGALSDLVKKGLSRGVDNLDPKRVAETIEEVLNGKWRKLGLRTVPRKESYVQLMMNIYEELLST